MHQEKRRETQANSKGAPHQYRLCRAHSLPVVFLPLLPKRRLCKIELVTWDDIDHHVRKPLLEIIHEYLRIARDDDVAPAKRIRRTIVSVRP